ncbi:hypothetical protein Q7C_1437 [Methylophaga frappieri]|uniref:Uncharacterized protein n=1 Tax=Methylophaga frappieri (strain ATCC BAA-2434 / DSM 25690 / JAM7) TaxID=754477 RepID=I1YI44_METFJ|nr:DUF6575 domain-containing protein [Methylophaga frappieri]AFJ02587.1 hypothetical protein Q7C_1437 [Methylophaga frappieri]
MLLNKKSQLGDLSIIEVYEYFDMPTLYCAKDKVMGTYYIVFWCDKKSEPVHKEGWLYLPISKNKLNLLRAKRISFREAYEQPERGYYLAYIGKDPEQDEVTFIRQKDLPDDFLPTEGFYVDSIDKWSSSPEESWIFRLVVKNVNKKTHKVAADISNAIQEQFTELFKSAMSLFDLSNKRVFNLYELGADFSSVDVRLGANDEELAYKALDVLENVFTAGNIEQLNEALSKYSLDTHQIEQFYNKIVSSNVNVKIIPKYIGNEIVLDNQSVKEKLDPLKNTNLTSISSIDVPQANDIETILKVMDLVDHGKTLTHDNFENINSPRQVSYYVDAAKALGLLTRKNEITSEGSFLLTRKSNHIKYQVLANLFELSECGTKWMRYCEKSDISELDPNSAEQFLLNCVSSLSEKTAKRRATTLKKWLADLQPYKIEYKEDI